MFKVALAVLFVLGAASPAHAEEVTQFAWDRTGAEALPCSGDVHWHLVAPGITTATVGINDDDGVADGHGWVMLADGSDWSITSTEPVATTDEVLVAYLGTATSTPALELVGCAGAPPPSVPPTVPTTTEPAPTTLPPAPSSQVHWEIGFTVHTIRRTNVAVRYRVRCSNAIAVVVEKQRIVAKTPLVRHLPPTLVDATSCSIRVVAWDIPPHVRPHNWPAPVVETWAEAV
jgi:hypothetical protein